MFDQYNNFQILALFEIIFDFSFSGRKTRSRAGKKAEQNTPPPTRATRRRTKVIFYIHILGYWDEGNNFWAFMMIKNAF